MEDDDVSLSNDNAAHQDSVSLLPDDDSVASSEECFGSEESFGSNNVFADNSAESLPVESDYSCFTTSQQCVTSLMYLLDAMECPDYGFKVPPSCVESIQAALVSLDIVHRWYSN